MKRNLIASLLFACAVIFAAVAEVAKEKPSPPVENKDPIITMVMASSIDAKGALVNPRFSFPQNEKQITAIVYLGEIKGSQLTVTWYQTSDDGDTRLFEQQIPVKSRDRAFSVAKNPGMFFSAGNYKVVATLDGQTKEMEFEIIAPKIPAKKTSNSRDGTYLGGQIALQDERAVLAETHSDELFQPISYQPVVDQSQKQKISSPQDRFGHSTRSTAAPGQLPVPGQSGIAPQPPKPPPGATSTDCSMAIGGENPYTHGDTIWDYFGADCNPTPAAIEIYANMGGSSKLIDSYPEVYAVIGGNTLRVNPCSLDGGSDLPGAKVTVTATAHNVGSDQGRGSVSTVITLGDDTLAPRVHVVSTPARHSKVKAGDKIKLDVEATERRSGGPWQTGVKMIQVTAIPGGQVGDPWVNSASPLSQKCEQKTWKQSYKATYTVPNNPPPIIELCVLAEDYAGNPSNNCGEFETGNVWEGTLRNAIFSLFRGGAGSCRGEAWDYKLHLVVGHDGTVEGKAVGHLVSPPQCTFAVQGAQAKNKSGDVSGKFDGRQFELQVDITSNDGPTTGVDSLVNLPGQAPKLLVPVTNPGIAQGETDTSRQAGTVVGTGHQTLMLKCVDCK